MAGNYDEGALATDLKTWWDDQVGGGKDDPFADPSAPTAGTIFDVIPAVDSLGVVTGLITIEKHVGFKVSPRVIRRGGYNSFDDMITDLMPKIKILVEKKKATNDNPKKEAA
jgi:hypothetical protein